MNIDSDFWKEARTITFGIVALALVTAVVILGGSDYGSSKSWKMFQEKHQESPESNTVVHTTTIE
jgi:hypothetical protein